MKFDEKAPLDAVGASFLSQGRHATQCFEPTIFIQNLAIKHRDDWRFTSGIVGGSVRCKEDGRRRIPQGVIRNLLERKLLYQDAEHSNAVFLSRRKDFAEIRGTIQGKVYHSVRKKSSDLFWGYHPDPETRCTKAFVCEGAIDALSLYVLHVLNQQADPGYVYCSIAGVANQKTIDRIASYLPIVLAVDNDEAGQKCRERNPGVEAVIPSKKDWNEDLLALLALDD